MSECKTCKGEGKVSARQCWKNVNDGSESFINLSRKIDCPDCVNTPLEQCKAKIDAALMEFNAELSISAEYKTYSDDASIDDFFIQLSIGDKFMAYNGKKVGE